MINTIDTMARSISAACESISASFDFGLAALRSRACFARLSLVPFKILSAQEMPLLGADEPMPNSGGDARRVL